MSRLFAYCQAVTSLDIDEWDTGNVTSMTWLFSKCMAVASLNIANWDIGKVEYMSGMFEYCIVLSSLDVSKWNTSKVTSLQSVFETCLELSTLDLSGWDTQNVTSMSEMFSSTKIKELDLSNFNTEKVEDMGYMFDCCDSLTKLDISGFNTSKVTDYESMFKIVNLSSINISGNVSEGIVNQIYPLGGGDLYADVPMWVDKDGAASNKIPTVDGKSVAGEYTAKLKPIFTKVEATLDGTEITISPNENGTTLKAALHTFVTDELRPSISKITIEPQDNGDKIIAEDDLDSLFCDYTALTTISGMQHLDMSNVVSMRLLFQNCSSIKALDLSMWNVCGVESMSSMFKGCTSLLTIDLSMWDVRGVEYMSSMFEECTSLVTLDLSSWQANYAEGLTYMFKNCTSLRSLYLPQMNGSRIHSNFSIGMFTNTQLNYVKVSSDISSIITNQILPREGGAYAGMWVDKDGNETAKIPVADGKAVLGEYYAKINTTKVKATLTGTEVTIEPSADGTTLKAALDAVATSSVRPTITKISILPQANGDKIVPECDLSELFAPKRTGKFGTYPFEKLESIVGLENVDMSLVDDMSQMFSGCSSLETLDVSSFNTEQVTDMSTMFSGCSSLTSLDVSNFNTDKVTAISVMFRDCSSLSTLDVSNFNTRNVVTLSTMFYNCSSLTSLDLSSFNTTNVVTLSSMFTDCSNLTSLDISNFNTSKVTQTENMFANVTLDTVTISSEISKEISDMILPRAKEGETPTWFAADGTTSANIPVVDSKAVAGKYCSSSEAESSVNEVEIAAPFTQVGSTLVFAKPTAAVVYNIAGVMLYNGTTSEYTLPSIGMYIICTEFGSFKVVW